MTDVQKCFIDIIKDVVLGVELPDDYKVCDLVELYKLSKKQDMAHIIAYGLKKHNLIDSNSELWDKHYKKQYSLAQFRVTNLQFEFERVCQALEETEIDYIPLKGVVIRPLYPEAWMRVSSDIDILVRSEEIEKADRVLENKFGYSIERGIAHHDHIKTTSGFVVEMHYTLTTQNVKAKKMLDDVWNKVNLENNTKHRFYMNRDMFYFYHIYHASKHFKDGGCGIKTILDTWFINNKLGIYCDDCVNMLRQYDLYNFAKVIESISEKWFSTSHQNDFEGIEFVENYIFYGGIYGSENHVSAKQTKADSKSFKYTFQRAFPSYDFMCERYCQLRGKPLLLPYYWLKRIATAFGKKDGKRTKAEIKTAWLEKEKSKQIKAMFDELGL